MIAINQWLEAIKQSKQRRNLHYFVSPLLATEWESSHPNRDQKKIIEVSATWKSVKRQLYAELSPFQSWQNKGQLLFWGTSTRYKPGVQTFLIWRNRLEITRYNTW